MMDATSHISSGSDPQAIEEAAALLDSGQVVVFPTETVYGLGADAFNPMAIARIFELKERPLFDPLIVHICHRDWVSKLSTDVPEAAWALMDRFWPGPLTIILEKREIVPDIVTSGLSTVGIRMPGHPVALRLIERLGRPIAAPSANPFGYMSTTTAADVASLFDGRLPMILDGGSSSYGIESTIVSFLGGRLRLHRHGSIPIEELEAAAGPILEKSPDDHRCESPGELPYHYAPHAPLRIIAGPEEIETDDSAYLAFTRPVSPVRAGYVRVLSEHGDMREAASRFFSSLIALDRERPQIIYAQRIAEIGLGKAIMERLKKAAQKTGA